MQNLIVKLKIKNYEGKEVWENKTKDYEICEINSKLYIKGYNERKSPIWLYFSFSQILAWLNDIGQEDILSFEILDNNMWKKLNEVL